MMRALVYHGRNDIRLDQVSGPGIGPGEAKVRITNASICATDIEEWEYGPTYITSVPTVMGHEVSGRVVEVGDGSSGLSVGDRVMVDNVIVCGTCYWCISGSQATCPNMEVAGLGREGGFAEFMTWPADHLIKLPDSVKDDEAPLLEPATVAVHAVRRSGVRVGESVAVLGLGTVGALTLQAFKAAGAVVYAVDVRKNSLQMATRLGADEVINANTGDAGDRLRDLTGGIGPDFVVETAGAARTPLDAFDWVRRAGTVVLVEIYAARPEANFNVIVGKELRVIGSVAAGTGDMRAAVRLAADGNIRLGDLVSDRISLDRVIPDGFERMAANRKMCSGYWYRPTRDSYLNKTPSNISRKARLMHYEGERTYGCRISSAWTYRGLRTVVLENELLRVIVLADKGADIYSIVHKPSDTDFMWRTPWGVRDPQKFIPTTGGAENNWLDVYEGGWQTVVPHGGYPSTVAGAELGLHAEMSTIPWDVVIDEDTPERVAVTFSVRGYRTPFSVAKTLSLESGSGVLTLDETVTNDGEVEADAVWLEHLAIGAPFLSDRCRLDVPQCTVLTDHESTDESSKLVTDHKGPWPNVPAKDGTLINFTRMPPMEDRSLDMAYMTEMPEGWYAITNEETEVGFGLRFPVDVFPYLWYWRNLGGGWGYPWYGRCYNVGLEPCTSMSNGGLAGAIENGTARHFAAGESLSVTIKAVAYTGAGRVTGIDADGVVTRG